MYVFTYVYIYMYIILISVDSHMYSGCLEPHTVGSGRSSTVDPIR